MLTAHCSTAQDCGPCPRGPVWQWCYSHRIGIAGSRVEERMNKETESLSLGESFQELPFSLDLIGQN